jgi:hypothetical protein
MEKLTKNLLDKIIKEIKNEEIQKQMEIEIFNPLLMKCYPYFIIFLSIFFLNFILIIIIFILIIIILNYK